MGKEVFAPNGNTQFNASKIPPMVPSGEYR
jgi:hypothetical protein